MSISNKNHISELAYALSKSDKGFRPDGLFLVRIAVLVCIDYHFCYIPTDSQHHSELCVQGILVQATGLLLPANSKKSQMAITPNSKLHPHFLVIVVLTQTHNLLAEYYLEDQTKYPKVGTVPVTADFTPALSDSSIVRTAGQLMNS